MRLLQWTGPAVRRSRVQNRFRPRPLSFMLGAMNTPLVDLCDDRECQELEAFLVERIYEFNARATGYFDGRLIGGRLRNEAGEIIAAFNGHTWGGCCVVAHLWVHESQRG